MYFELIRKIRDDIYVDDLVARGESLQEVKKMKSDSIELFKKGELNFTNGTQMNQI